MGKPVDFAQPIIAVLPRGKTAPATFIKPGDDTRSFYVEVLGVGMVVVGRDGHAFGREVVIINDEQFSTSSNEELTQRMVVEGQSLKMLRHVLTIAADHPMVGDEAAKLLSDLPKPVDPLDDPDFQQARELCAKDAELIGDRGLAAEYRAGENDSNSWVRIAFASIKLGRTLAAGGTAHE